MASSNILFFGNRIKSCFAKIRPPTLLATTTAIAPPSLHKHHARSNCLQHPLVVAGVSPLNVIGSLLRRFKWANFRASDAAQDPIELAKQAPNNISCDTILGKNADPFCVSGRKRPVQQLCCYNINVFGTFLSSSQRRKCMGCSALFFFRSDDNEEVVLPDNVCCCGLWLCGSIRFGHRSRFLAAGRL